MMRIISPCHFLKTITTKCSKRWIHRQPFSTRTAALERQEKTKFLRLYRILLRQCQNVVWDPQQEWLLQPPLNPRDYGQARILTTTTKNQSMTLNGSSEIHQLLNWFRIWNNIYINDISDGEDDPQDNQWFLSAIGTDNEDWQEDGDNDEELESLWVSQSLLLDATRHAFRNAPPDDSNVSQGLAINAVRLLNEQESMVRRSSISTDEEYGVRVVATSRCIGTAPPGVQQDTKHRFAYRIRVENLPENDKTVQLLGRTWHIQETEGSSAVGEPISVVAPKNGAVGHMPVLNPGQAFEYMSGCELSTRTGIMEGSFLMAIVPQDTESAALGDLVEALELEEQHFETPVEPFVLVADY